jgi:malate dehydrogenase (decarboxylating)
MNPISVHMVDGKYLRVEIVHKKGIDLIHEPLYYKGMAHSISERDRLQIRGLIPPIVKSIEC